MVKKQHSPDGSIDSKSVKYHVLYNECLMRDDFSDLEEAIKFAYSLHIGCLSCSHAVKVLFKNNGFDFVYATFLTSDFFEIPSYAAE